MKINQNKEDGAEALMLEDFKELGTEIEISESLNEFEPLKDIENKHKEKTKTLKINVKEKNEKTKKTFYVNTKEESVHLKLKTQKNASLDLAIIFSETKNNSLIVEAELKENSFARITCFSKNTELLTRYNADCSENSRFEAINFSLSNTDSESRINLKDEASCLLVNSYYNDKQRTTAKDLVIHQGKNTNSLITSKGYLKNSQSDSRGLIKIEPSANNAQGFQEAHILLEEKSKATSIPDLEIGNNEVKCSHGSTISRIKDEDLFYFESRGITKKEAKKILIKGHLLSIIPKELSEFAKKFFEETRGEI